MVLDPPLLIYPIGKNRASERVAQTSSVHAHGHPLTANSMLISHVAFGLSLHYSRTLFLKHHLCKTYLKYLLEHRFASPSQDQFKPSP